MPIFVRDSFADDVDNVLRFFSKLLETNPDDSTTDKVRWKLNSKGCFTVRSFYMKLLNRIIRQWGFWELEISLASSFGGLWRLSRFHSSFGKLHIGRF